MEGRGRKRRGGQGGGRGGGTREGEKSEKKVRKCGVLGSTKHGREEMLTGLEKEDQGAF